MPSTKDILERSPFYAFIGAADVALETVRNTFETATDSAASFRDDFTPEQVQERIVGTVNDVRDQITALPALATEQYEAVAGNVQRAYEEFAQNYLEFAERGVELTQQFATQSLSAVTAARDAAREAGDNTFAAVLDARKEAAKGVERLAGLAGRGADVVESEAETVVRSAAAKQGAAKRTAAKRPSRKAVAKKASAKKVAAKPAAKKTAAAKAPAKKTAAKKAPAKKAAAKKVAPAKVAETAPTLPVEASDNA